MKKKHIFRVALVFFGALLILTGCTSGDIIQRRYYIFDYIEENEKTELYQVEPIPYNLLIHDAQISQTYSRKQLVKRHYGPQIRYMDYDLWGIKLSDAIANLAARRCNNYNLFSSVNRSSITEVPDYQLNITVANLEMYETEYLSEAHLNMEFRLYKVNESDKNVPDYNVEYSFDVTKRLPNKEIEIFVQEINAMILEETDKFVAEVIKQFTGKEQILTEKITEQETYEEIDYSPDITGDSLYADGRSIGLLYMPNLSGEENEPFFNVFDMQNNFIVSARFGEEIPLPEGEYYLRYGSGGEDQEIVKTVEVRPRWRYNVVPNWGCLIVDIMDEQRNYVKTSYNLFDNESGYDYGIEYPADINLGEKQTVWILKPGTYKVTINSESYNTYRDFTTIEIEDNKCQRLTLVVEEDETTGLVSLLGAGVMKEDDSQSEDSNWNQNSAVHVNFNLQSDNSDEKQNSEISVNMSAQLDNTFTYDYGRLNYRMKNLIEVGTNKDEGIDEFRVDLDDFDMKNTLILNVISSIGLYGRLDMNTHFFPSYAYDLNYIKVSASGDSSAPQQNVSRFQTNPSLFPLTLKEGLGLNFQFLDTSRADMNLRTGFGFRQDIRNNVYSYSQDEEIDGTNYKVYTEEESNYSEGIEASLVGDLQIFRNLNYSLTADILFPFDDLQNYTMDMENIFNLKLFKYISIDYRLKFYSRESEGKLDYIANQQSLFLRFTYILR